MADTLFLDALRERVMLGDGAYGTEFLRRGVPADRPLVELNLKRPQVVLDLHREYVAAGAELLKTNTFTANRLRLRKAGLESQVREINIQGVKLAREAARDAFVAGSVGPLSEFPWKGREEAYQEQCEALAEGGCDLLLFETFQSVDDLLKALGAATSTGLPLIGQFATQEVLRYTRMIQQAAGPEAMGVNCVTAAQSLRALKHLKEAGCLLSAFPSGGLPEKPVSPQEFATGVLSLVEAGCRLVGGCCGAGPDHIRAAASALGRPR